ncbi:MAG: hypothetical protein ACRENE_27120 [Polyangiaceae bacterium]
MRLLLDTHAFIGWDNHRLPKGSIVSADEALSAYAIPVVWV